MALNDSLQKQISELVSANRVILFMKGTRQMPQCGFSAQVVQILDELLPSYETLDVLRSPAMRDGIKEFSQWPTIPQLYIDGKFIGGLRHRSGDECLGRAPEAHRCGGLGAEDTDDHDKRDGHQGEAAVAEAGGNSLRLQIDAQFQHKLFFGPRGPGDVEARVNGLTVLIDRASVGPGRRREHRVHRWT